MSWLHLLSHAPSSLSLSLTLSLFSCNCNLCLAAPPSCPTVICHWQVLGLPTWRPHTHTHRQWQRHIRIACCMSTRVFHHGRRCRRCCHLQLSPLPHWILSAARWPLLQHCSATRCACGATIKWAWCNIWLIAMPGQVAGCKQWLVPGKQCPGMACPPATLSGSHLPLATAPCPFPMPLFGCLPESSWHWLPLPGTPRNEWWRGCQTNQRLSNVDNISLSAPRCMPPFYTLPPCHQPACLLSVCCPWRYKSH